MTKHMRPRTCAPCSAQGAILELLDQVLAVVEENREHLSLTSRLVGAYGFDPHHSACALTRMGRSMIHCGGIAYARDRGTREGTAKAFKQPKRGRR
jgi:hypothetical protein